MTTKQIRTPGPARPLTDDEIESITAAASRRDRALVWLCLGGGLRVGEACSLLIGHVGSDQSVLIEAHNSKSREPRRVYLSDRAWTELQRWLEQRPGDAQLPVFPSRKGGGCMHRGHGSRLVHGLLQAAGVLGASSHSLRRSHAHGLRDQGADLMVIKAQLGHSSISVTEKYMAVYPREQRETVARLQLGRSAA